MTYQIAQFIWPSDSFGHQLSAATGGINVDWPHGRCYLWNDKVIRSYSTAFATQYPIVSTAVPSPTILVVGVGITTDGYPLLAANAVGTHGPIYKLDPNTLLPVASWGSAGAYPHGLVQLVNTPGKTLACISVNGVPYALGQEIVFGPHGGIFRTDTMTASGFYQVISSSSFTPGQAYICAGQSGGSTGTFYAMTSILSPTPASATSVTLRKITVQSGAETWTVSQWPTPNPYISMSSILVLTATAVDASWIGIQCTSLGYDTEHDIVIALVGDYGGGVQQYLVGIDPSGSIVWKTLLPVVPAPDTTPNLTQMRDASGYITVVGNGDLAFVNQYHTSDGSTFSTGLIGGLGAIVRGSVTDDVSGNWIGGVEYTSTASGAPVPLSGTPTTFVGTAMLQPVLITPTKMGLDDLICVEQALSGQDGLTRLTLDWSDDAGASWSNGLEQSLGQVGQYITNVQFRRLGMARNRVFRLTWSGPMGTALTGMMVQYEVAAT